MTYPTADLDAHYALTQEQIARYRADGCVRLGGVLSSATLDRYRDRFARLVKERASTEPLERRGTYGKAFQQIINLWRVDARARALVFGQRLARIAAEIMGVAGVRIYHDQALYKEPGGGHTPWHCDQMYWPLASPDCVTAWIPFQAVPMEMGPLSFALGSHRADFGRHLEISDESERVIATKVTDLPKRSEPFALGDVSFHAGWTFHRAPENATNAMRAVMTVIYMADGMRLKAPERPQQQGDADAFCPGVRPGEAIASALNPLVYRAALASEPVVAGGSTR
jgi:ectoine hydroxylase-related dioxygenase (phytanoyl-CoA dioxygenase family)